MNQKTARKLRKVAKQMATEAYGTTYMSNSVIKRYGDEDTMPIVLPGTLVVNANCERGVYLKLKAANESLNNF